MIVYFFFKGNFRRFFFCRLNDFFFFSMVVIRFKDVFFFGFFIFSGIIFRKFDVFRDFLLVKVINVENVAYKFDKFYIMVIRTR